MASVPTSDVPTGRPGPNRANPADLPFFRFGLKQLFIYVSFVCILLAAMVIVKGIAALAVLLVALVIGAHVLGTALGTRLRDKADNQRNDLSPHSSFLIGHSSFSPTPSLWHGRNRDALRRLPLLIAAGIAFGGVAGGIFLAYAIGSRTSIAGVMIGALSLAVVGGWIAFIASSFYAIFRDGLREAITEQKKDEAR